VFVAACAVLLTAGVAAVLSGLLDFAAAGRMGAWLLGDRGHGLHSCLRVGLAYQVFQRAIVGLESV
jgi:hypothetical protein